MKIMAIETTGAYASVAIIDELGNVDMEISYEKLSHLKTLMKLAEKLIKELKIKFEDLDYIAASEGPGSFTGIRIGVSTARALAQVSNKKAIGISALEAFKFNYLAEFEKEEKVLICPMFDARRNQVYGQGLLIENDIFKETIEKGPYMIDEFLELIEESGLENKKKIVFYGDGVDQQKERLGEWKNSLSEKGHGVAVEFAKEEFRYQRAEYVARLALELAEKGQVKDYEELKPVYMRMPEAERQLKDKIQAEKAKKKV